MRRARVHAPRSLSIIHLEAYIVELEHRGMRAVSRRRAVAVVRSFAAYLAASGSLPTDIARSLIPPGRASEELTVLDSDDCRRVKAVARHEPRAAALIAVLLDGGLRISEAARLCIGDVTLARTLLDARVGSLQVRGHRHLARTVPLGTRACASLLPYLAERGHATDAPLFLSRRGRPLTVRGIRLVAMRCLAAAGIDHATVHTLRHTYAVRLLRAGAPHETARRILGHAPSTRSRYTSRC